MRNAEYWERAYEVTEDECLKGQFLIDNLGASRYIDPQIAMTRLVLRQKMIYDMQIESAQGCTLMNNALTAQYGTFKLQRMLGDFAISVEMELFRGDSLSAILKEGEGLDVN